MWQPHRSGVQQRSEELTKMKKLLILTAVVALALVAAACGVMRELRPKVMTSVVAK